MADLTHTQKNVSTRSHAYAPGVAPLLSPLLEAAAPPLAVPMVDPLFDPVVDILRPGGLTLKTPGGPTLKTPGGPTLDRLVNLLLDPLVDLHGPPPRVLPCCWFPNHVAYVGRRPRIGTSGLSFLGCAGPFRVPECMSTLQSKLS